MEQKQKHLTVFGWIMLAWFCLSVGMLVLGLVGWMTERWTFWFANMDRDDMFGVMGFFGGVSIVCQVLVLTTAEPSAPDDWFVTSE